MSFISKTIELEVLLESISGGLKRKRDEPKFRRYAAQYYDQLRPLVLMFSIAIHKNKDREQAKEVLSEIKPIITRLGAMHTKGDIFLVEEKFLEEFTELSTIFQESTYRRQVLK